MAKRVATEHVADVKAGELSGVGTVLNKKSRQSSLNESVLIPIRATLNKVRHGLVQGQGHVGLKTNDVLFLDGLRRCLACNNSFGINNLIGQQLALNHSRLLRHLAQNLWPVLHKHKGLAREANQPIGNQSLHETEAINAVLNWD